jgi:hypothetical protein
MIAELAVKENYSGYLKRIAKLGVKQLGKGRDSVVFQHPTDPKVVVKMTSEEMSGSLGWLKWCSRSRNPFAPRVYHMQKAKLGTYLYVFSFMERLTPTKFDTVAKVVNAELPVEFRKPARVMRLGIFSKEEIENIKDPDLREVITVMSRMAGKIDFKDGNYMLRGTQLVFTDPVTR